MHDPPLGGLFVFKGPCTEGQAFDTRTVWLLEVAATLTEYDVAGLDDARTPVVYVETAPLVEGVPEVPLPGVHANEYGDAPPVTVAVQLIVLLELRAPVHDRVGDDPGPLQTSNSGLHELEAEAPDELKLSQPMTSLPQAYPVNAPVSGLYVTPLLPLASGETWLVPDSSIQPSQPEVVVEVEEELPLELEVPNQIYPKEPVIANSVPSDE